MDKQTLRREAEAIVALADTSEGPVACATCGSSNTDDSRYCRLCGTPYCGREPAELEVVRLTAGARAGYHLNTTGVICLLLTLLAALPLTLLGQPKAVGLGWSLLTVGGIAGVTLLVLGTLRLRQTLNTTEGDKRQAAPGASDRRFR